MKRAKPKAPKAKKITKAERIKELESRIEHLQLEVVSALKEHSRALIQRNHAEEMSQSIYEALRKILMMCQNLR